MEIVQSIATLNAMAKKGLIKLHNQTGTKIKGLYGGKSFTCCYIDDKCDGIPSTFMFRGAWYTIEYRSGCFCPYVVSIPAPTWVNNWQKGFATLKEFNDYFSGKKVTNNLQIQN